jgi:heat shock protein HslJ
MLRAVLAAAFLFVPPTLLAQNSAAPKTGQLLTSPSPLFHTHWTLTELNRKPINPDPGAKEAYLVLDGDSKRISGTGGCNQLLGSFENEGRSLHFKGVASTMMACSGGTMQQEQTLLHALSDCASYSIHGTTLTLLGKNSKALARFEAQDTAQSAN